MSAFSDQARHDCVIATRGALNADYLIRRDGRYSYPREVTEVLKRSEFVKALGTADRKKRQGWHGR